jgi:antitoxin ParD1/3/4
MTTMNVSLPDSLKSFVELQVQQHGYSTASEYIRELIRIDQARKAEQRLAGLILEGLRSGAPIEADELYWDGKKARLSQRTEV